MQRTNHTVSIQDRLCELLAEIEGLFKDERALTLIARCVATPDGSQDVCVSDDPDYEAVASALRSLWRDPSTGLGLSEAIRRQLQS